MDSRQSVATDIPLASSVALGCDVSQCTTPLNFVKVCHHQKGADLDQLFSTLGNKRDGCEVVVQAGKDDPKALETLMHLGTSA